MHKRTMLVMMKESLAQLKTMATSAVQFIKLNPPQRSLMTSGLRSQEILQLSLKIGLWMTFSLAIWNCHSTVSQTSFLRTGLRSTTLKVLSARSSGSMKEVTITLVSTMAAPQMQLCVCLSLTLSSQRLAVSLLLLPSSSSSMVIDQETCLPT